MNAVEAADLIPGWMTRDELAWLAATAAALPAGATWLEMGAFCGRSTLAVGLSLPPGSTLLVVDRWPAARHWCARPWRQCVVPEEGGPAWEIIDPGETPRRRFLRTLARLRAARPDLTVRLHQMRTTEAALVIEEGSCDVAFIDADHARASVVADCAVAERLLKRGGLLCGHDHGQPGQPDVAAVIDERYPSRQVAAGTSVWNVRSA